MIATATATSVLLSVSDSDANIVAPTGQIAVIAAPEASNGFTRGVCFTSAIPCRNALGSPSCSSGTPRTDETNILAFNEKSNFRLLLGTGNLVATAPSLKYGGNQDHLAVYDDLVDPVSFWIDEGNAIVSSHLVHRRRPGPTFPTAGNDKTGTLTFDSDIISAIMIDNQLDDSDLRVGNPATCYPVSGGRSPDVDLDSDYIKYFPGEPRKIEIHFATGSALDQVRVITEGNRRPDAVNDPSITTAQDTPVSGAVLGNDFDVDGTPLTAVLSANPTNGSLSWNANGSFTYTPFPGYFGPDAFFYTACDPGTVTTRDGEPDPPINQLCDLTPVRIDITITQASTPTPTNTPTSTATATPTATPTVTPTVTACGGDADCDGYLDPQQANHAGPSNTTVSADNCPADSNSPQLNADGNYIDNSPPYAPATDDKTHPNSDNMGDACDPDDDNDGITDSDETSGADCDGVVTDALLRDTDGDRFLDGAECTMNSDPTSAASRPFISTCGATVDEDGDKIASRIEYCFYNSNPFVTDTDGDGALDGGKDGCEVASLNADRIVNSLDQGMLASGISGAQPYTPIPISTRTACSTRSTRASWPASSSPPDNVLNCGY